MITATLILCATLMILWAATMFILLYNGLPVFSLTIINTVEPPRVILRQSAKQVFV